MKTNFDHHLDLAEHRAIRLALALFLVWHLWQFGMAVIFSHSRVSPQIGPWLSGYEPVADSNVSLAGKNDDLLCIETHDEQGPLIVFFDRSPEEVTPSVVQRCIFALGEIADHRKGLRPRAVLTSYRDFSSHAQLVATGANIQLHRLQYQERPEYLPTAVAKFTPTSVSHLF